MSEHDCRCQEAMARMHAFLDNELDDATADDIRTHLDACAGCVETYDVEMVMRTVIKRGCTASGAPAELRARVIAMRARFRPQ